MYVFQQLKKYVEDHELEFTVSPKIAEKKIWEEIIVGGKITDIVPDFLHIELGHYFVQIDDDVSTISLYVIKPIYDEYKNILVKGNIILAKGRVIEKRIEGTKTISRHIAVNSIDVVQVISTQQ